MQLRIKFFANSLRSLLKLENHACMVLGDGEHFAGNGYDSTNYVRLYAEGREIGQYEYHPEKSK
ncbi:hypothetical protein JCM15908A_02690 [Prevotella dentasini JCM 15908]